MKINKRYVAAVLMHSKTLCSSEVFRSIAYMLTLMLGLFSSPSFADRFDAPSINFQAQNFDSRIDSNLFNVDFLVAHVINNGRKTVREVGEITDEVESLINTLVFTNNTNSDGTSAGSVIIPPGTSADTIIIINQNEGDSIAINR